MQSGSTWSEHAGVDFQIPAHTVSTTVDARDRSCRSTTAATFESTSNTGPDMLFTIALVLIILWLLGLVSGVVMGQFIHILLVVAVVLLLVQLIGGSRRK